jgi:outer membrane protein TolC
MSTVTAFISTITVAATVALAQPPPATSTAPPATTTVPAQSPATPQIPPTTLAPPQPQTTVRITIADAIRLALSEGTQARLARSAEERARYNERLALTGLLPRAEANLMRYNQSINLATFGLSLPGLPPVVGPFNVTDAQLVGQIELFNLAALRRYQASRAGVSGSRYQVQAAENDVAAAVARLYVMIGRAEAQMASRQADVTLFQRLAGVAEDEFGAGTGTRLDVAQAKVQLARTRQALLTARNDRENARVALLNAIGANEGSELVLADTLATPPAVPAADAALSAALAQRPELKGLAEAERAAKLGVKAARAAYMPSVGVDFAGDLSGNQTQDLRSSRRIAAMASVPLFHGEIAAYLGLAKVQLQDVQTQRAGAQRDIEQEVRNSLASVDNANARVAVATENVQVAEEALTIAEDRRRAGYGSSVEVDRAEDAYRQAHEDLIAARADAAMAWYSLQHATGGIRLLIPGTPGQ